MRAARVLRGLTAVLALGLGTLSACSVEDPTPRVRYDGPLGDSSPGDIHILTIRKRHRPPGTLFDVEAVPLKNSSDGPVTIDGVDITPQSGSEPLAVGGTFIAGPHSVSNFSVAAPSPRGYWHAPMTQAAGFELPPGDLGYRLIVRIGPPAYRGTPTTARNNAIVIRYHDTEGQAYVMGYPLQFEYPVP